MHCYTCGTETAGYSYACPACETNTQLRALRADNRDASRRELSALGELQRSQEQGLGVLLTATTEGFAGLATALQWGFGEINWRMQQETQVLKAIDHTLRTPSETQANEWREMAEELRRRGVLDESIEFYAKSLDLNRLDYRAYAGLAETCIQCSRFDEAETALQRSLPHAPRGELDYKSYSYRQLGHIAWCRTDYFQAFLLVQTAVELSPDYVEAVYDLAQYAALTGRTQECVDSLQTAVRAMPSYWYLAKSERSFDSARSYVDAALDGMKQATREAAEHDCSMATAEVSAGRSEVEAAGSAVQAMGSHHQLESATRLATAEQELTRLTRDVVDRNDYVDLLEFARRASVTLAEIGQAVLLARGERERLEAEARAEAIRQAKVQTAEALRQSELTAVLGSIPGAFGRELSQTKTLNATPGITARHILTWGAPKEEEVTWAAYIREFMYRHLVPDSLSRAGSAVPPGGYDRFSDRLLSAFSALITPPGNALWLWSTADGCIVLCRVISEGIMRSRSQEIRFTFCHYKSSPEPASTYAWVCLQSDSEQVKVETGLWPDAQEATLLLQGVLNLALALPTRDEFQTGKRVLPADGSTLTAAKPDENPPD